jgi:UDPglucose 6-dehydrogenase/GDP-mannose 6-dehydrogenase
MKVSIIGTGYVGLVSGVCLAEKGHRVICVDVDPVKVDQINRAEPPIYERGLAALLQKNVGVRLTATTDLARAVHDTELSLIAVGTPFADNEIDLTAIRNVSRQVGLALKTKASYHSVIVKSTVVPGTTESVIAPLLEEASAKKAGIDFGVGVNPEFLREGEAIDDFMNPDRIVLAGIDERTFDLLENLYRVFDGIDKVRTNPKTAEMIKYTANALLATMVSFSNEIGNLAAALGNIDALDVMRGVHLDKRISPIMPGGARIIPAFTTYLEAGCGFGGSCFPKDVKALIAHGERAGSPMRLLKQVVDVNECQPRVVVSLVKKHFTDLTDVIVTILGLAFKPGTDDVRESPAIPVVKALLAEGARVKAYDPCAVHEARKILADCQLTYCGELAQAIDSANAIVLMTGWPEFQQLPALLAGRDPQPLVVDGRRMLDKRSVARYEGIGLS